MEAKERTRERAEALKPLRGVKVTNLRGHKGTLYNDSLTNTIKNIHFSLREQLKSTQIITGEVTTSEHRRGALIIPS